MKTKESMQSAIRVDGFLFKWQDEHGFYDCRGDVCYDDEHDEVPDERLWQAAHSLAKILQKDGWDTEVTHSEKGWVEVQIINYES